MKMRIRPWNEQLIMVNGNWEPAYKLICSVSYFIPTEEQKRELKKHGKKVVDGKIVKISQ